MSNENKNNTLSLLEKIGLVERVEKGNSKQIFGRKELWKINIITCIITIAVYEIIDHVGNLNLNGKLFSVETIYFFVIWMILFSITHLILVTIVFKKKKQI